MIKWHLQYIPSGIEGGVNKSFIHWTVIESVHQGVDFEIDLG